MNGLDLQSRKLWLGGGAVLALLILLAFWLLAIGPKRSDAASQRQQTADAQVQNAQLGGQNAALVRKSHHIVSYQAKLATALAALPSRNKLSIFTQSLTAYAQASGVQLTSISVGAPSAAVSAATTAPTPEATDSESGSAGSSDTSTAPAPVPTVTAVGPLSITFTVQASGTTAQELAFLTAVRTGPRSALVSSAQFGASTTGTGNTLTAQVNVFSSALPAAQLSQLRHLLQPAK